MTKTKFEVMNECNALDIPVGPILSMKEIAEEPSLRETGTVVEVDHPTRGKYLSVGNPIKLSDSITEVKRSPLLGEHTDEILTKVLKFTPREIAEIKASGATGEAPKAPAQSKRRGVTHAHRGPWPAGLRQGRAGSAAEARRERRRRLCGAGEARPEGRSSQGSGARGQAAGVPAGLLPQARGAGRSSRR